MILDRNDENGKFSIAIDDHDWREIDLLRMEAAAGKRAATFIKKALGYEAMLALINEESASADRRWKVWVDQSCGRYRSAVMTFRVQGMLPDQFYAYIIQNAGETLQFKMHPEHYVSHFSDGLNGIAIIAETWGTATIRSYARFSDIQVLRDEGIDIEPILDSNASQRMAAIGRTQDGNFIAAVLHQIIPSVDGFLFKTCAFLPEAVPDEIMAGLDQHAAVEFTNMIRVAREAEVAKAC